jgi:hypothetical protein
MGYTTRFVGALKFTRELKASEIAHLNTILGVDFRHTPEVGQDFLAIAPSQYSIDLKFTQNYDGLEWDGSEKSYSMLEQVNFVINYMRATLSPDFGVKGRMDAQGEDIDDRWAIIIGDDGGANRIDIKHSGRKVQCPNCEEYFYIDDNCE